MRLNLSVILQWRVNIFLYQKLGWKRALFYIMVLGKAYFFLKRTEKKKIQSALQTVFGTQKDPVEIKNISQRVFRGILWHYFEKIINVYSPVDKLKHFFTCYIKSEGLIALEEGLARGKGVLLVTGHFGGIEYIPTYLAAQNYPVTILAKFSSDHLRKISMDLAGRLVFKIVDTDTGSNIVKAIIHNLKENRIVITQCDEIEEWRPSLHEKISFLGKKIPLDKTINTLIRRGDPAVVFGLMKRSDPHGYRFITHSWNEILETFEPTSKMSMGEMILKFLERYIYHYPEDWYQWKKVPEIVTAEGDSAPMKEVKPSRWLKPAFGKTF